MEYGFIIMLFSLILISFLAIYGIISVGINDISELVDSTSDRVNHTEQDVVLDKVQTGGMPTISDIVSGWFTYDFTITTGLILLIIPLVLWIIYHLFYRGKNYRVLWRTYNENKYHEFMKKENSGYNAYLVSIQISEKLDFLVTFDGKPRMFYSNDSIFYKNNKTFEQIQKMLKEIQAVYTNYMKENNLKMNGYEANFKSVLKTIEKSEMISMLDNHKVLEGIFGTINYIHKDVVGSVEDTIVKDIQRDFEITKTIQDRRSNT